MYGGLRIYPYLILHPVVLLAFIPKYILNNIELLFHLRLLIVDF